MMTLLRRTVVACFTLLLLLSVAALQAAEPAALPNVLLIVADDLGWSDVGWHGGFGRTPN